MLDYIGPDPVTLLPRAWTEATVPDPVRVAVLLVVADLWAHRGDEPVSDTDTAWHGHLSPAATRYLQRLKEPVVS